MGTVEEPIAVWDEDDDVDDRDNPVLVVVVVNARQQPNEMYVTVKIRRSNCCDDTMIFFGNNYTKCIHT